MPAMPLATTAVVAALPGLRRAVHGLAHQSRLRFARRVARVGAEVAAAWLRDALRGVPGEDRRVLRVEEGRAAHPDARGVALYCHHSPTGTVSGMVRRQLAAYRRAGFAVVFVTSGEVREGDWQAALGESALAVHRLNVGRDFGAWRDAAADALRRWPGATELLLANDSVLGPIAPLEPVFAALREGGEGIFGLTESFQAGPHLQSYFVLARGAAAVATVAAFLRGLRPSGSKWLTVQRGEVGLTRFAAAAGQPVRALYGYRRLARAIAGDERERAYIAALGPRHAGRTPAGGADAGAALERALLDRPLNPTHHGWAALVRCLGFPYLKTELVRRNPGRLPGVADWRSLVPPSAPCPVPVLEEHLASLAP